MLAVAVDQEIRVLHLVEQVVVEPQVVQELREHLEL
jgi:hypothetical protein